MDNLLSQITTTTLLISLGRSKLGNSRSIMILIKQEKCEEKCQKCENKFDTFVECYSALQLKIYLIRN